MNGTSEHAGKRYVCLVRCSSTHQADTSIPDQLNLLKAFGDQHAMVHVDDVILDGVTGSIPGARNDIEQIIGRKQRHDDFDVLLVQDMSRFTRSGPEHGMKLGYDLRAAGIEVIFVADHLPEGDHSGIIKSVGFYAARQHAKAISFAASRGQMSALAQDRTTHCSNPPYGVDRLYVLSDGTPLHILRNMPDGSQQKIDPNNGRLIGTFVRNKGRGRSNHYRRQAGEFIRLMAGAPEQVETVRNIFRWSLAEGWGHWRIAKALNERGIPTAKGTQWSTSSVGQILKNPIYTGTGIANRYTQAVYHMRSPNAPMPAKVDPRALATRKAPPRRTRTKSQWLEQDHPLLRDYLGAELRELAVASQSAYLRSQGAGHTPKFTRDRHADSPYVLKNILRSKQGDHEMTGRTLGPRGRRVRYYAISRAYHVPGDALLRKVVPAEPMERAVMNLLRDVLLNVDDLRVRIRDLVLREQRSSKHSPSDLADLEGERQKLRQELEFIIESVGPLGKELAAKKMESIETKLQSLNAKIVKAKFVSTAQPLDVDVVVGTVIDGLRRLGESMGGPTSAALRKIFSALISRLTVNLETRQFEIELALPTSAIVSSGAPLCLDGLQPCPSANEAQRDTRVILARFDCVWKAKTFCPACRRKAA